MVRIGEDTAFVTDNPGRTPSGASGESYKDQREFSEVPGHTLVSNVFL